MTILIIFSYIAVLLVGYYYGNSAKKIDKHNIDLGMFYREECYKQAKMIDDFNDRLVYFSVGEIGDLYEYLTETEEMDDSTPILGVLYPFDNPNVKLESYKE